MIIWYCGATKQHQRLNWVPTATHQPRPMWRGSSWVTREHQKQTGGHDVQMGHWGWLSGERREVEVIHHDWGSVPSCLKECPQRQGQSWKNVGAFEDIEERSWDNSRRMDRIYGWMIWTVWWETTWWRIWPETNWIGVMIASLSKSENQIQTLEAWKGCVVQSLSPGLESLGGRRETKWILWIRTRHRS